MIQELRLDLKSIMSNKNENRLTTEALLSTTVLLVKNKGIMEDSSSIFLSLRSIGRDRSKNYSHTRRSILGGGRGGGIQRDRDFFFLTFPLFNFVDFL